MNKESISIWQESWTGPRAFLFWWLIVTVAGFLFATAMVTIAYFFAPWALFVFGTNLPICVLRTPELWAALVGLELMANFMIAVATAFVFYRAIRWHVARRVSSASLPAYEPSKLSNHS
jgi:hypothetical protein